MYAKVVSITKRAAAAASVCAAMALGGTVVYVYGGDPVAAQQARSDPGGNPVSKDRFAEGFGNLALVMRNMADQETDRFMAALDSAINTSGAFANDAARVRFREDLCAGLGLAGLPETIDAAGAQDLYSIQQWVKTRAMNIEDDAERERFKRDVNAVLDAAVTVGADPKPINP